MAHGGAAQVSSQSVQGAHDGEHPPCQGQEAVEVGLHRFHRADGLEDDGGIDRQAQAEAKYLTAPPHSLPQTSADGGQQDQPHQHAEKPCHILQPKTHGGGHGIQQIPPIRQLGGGGQSGFGILGKEAVGEEGLQLGRDCLGEGGIGGGHGDGLVGRRDGLGGTGRDRDGQNQAHRHKESAQPLNGSHTRTSRHAQKLGDGVQDGTDEGEGQKEDLQLPCRFHPRSQSRFSAVTADRGGGLGEKGHPQGLEED